MACCAATFATVDSRIASRTTTAPHAWYCPGRKPPFSAVKRPARPYKSATQTRFTVGNAKGTSPSLGGPDRKPDRPDRLDVVDAALVALGLGDRDRDRGLVQAEHVGRVHVLRLPYLPGPETAIFGG
jgi:hypothetical protein